MSIVVNCDLVDTSPARTLAELRTAVLRRLGYSAMAANPPPGMAELLDSFLDSANRLAFRTYNALRIERFFTWTMVPDQRFYGIDDNDNDGSAPALAQILDPQKVTWVGIEDLTGTVYPLHAGIPPEVYTRGASTTGWPQRYEIRNCIEVFPAPQEAYLLHIKGRYGILPFAGDTDKPSVDDEVVFMLALAAAKRHYGQPDASDYFQQALTHIGSLVAGAHQTRRYVPGTAPDVAIAPPRFLPLEP